MDRGKTKTIYGIVFIFFFFFEFKTQFCTRGNTFRNSCMISYILLFLSLKKKSDVPVNQGRKLVMHLQ